MEIDRFDLTGKILISDHLPPVFKGSSSTIYRATWGEKLVAVKVIRPVGDYTQREIDGERVIWESLDHPNILPFYGHANAQFEPFSAFISPWYSNGDASQFLQQHGRNMEVNARGELWKGVLAGVAFLHDQTPAIVHGYLTPENILIDDDGNPRICDFGLACLIREAGVYGLDMIIDYTGIIRYLPPELVMPLATILPTRESDVYALGCLGLEFIYLAKPYAHHGEDYSGQVLTDIYAGIPPAIRQEDAHLPLDIRWGNTNSWELLETLWSKQAGARPTASYVLTLIDNVVGETNDMVTIFAEQCRWADAERSQQDVLEQRRNRLGPDHPRAIKEAMTLASIYVEQEKWVEAEGLQLHILECQRRILGKDHLDAIRAAANLASTHHMQGNWNEARNMRLEILEQRQRILGEDHPYTILAVESLNATCKAPEEVEAANSSLRALLDVDSDSSHPLVKLVPTSDASAPLGAKKNGGRSKGITSDETHDTPVSVYETAPSNPTLLDGRKKGIERAGRPLAKAQNEDPTVLTKRHWRCVQLIALNLSLSETSMMVNPTSTFSQIGTQLRISNTATLPVALEQIPGPFPRWKIPNIDSRVPQGLQKIYVVDMSEPFTLALVRDVEGDSPLLLPLASFNASTITMGDLISASLGGRTKPISCIRLLSSSDDIQKQKCDLVQKEIKGVYSTTLFVLLDGDPMAYRFRNKCDSRVPPALRLAFAPCRSLVESAPRLKAFDLQAIGLSRALLHLTVCLAEAAAESKVEGATEAYLIARLNKLVNKLNGIFLDIESSTESARPGIRHSMDQFFYELCEEQPGVVSVRQIFESFKPLTPFNYENSGLTSKPAGGVHEGKTIDPAKPSGYEAENSSTDSSDSLTASDDESAEAHQQLRGDTQSEIHTTQKQGVLSAPGHSLDRPTQSFSAASTVSSTATTPRLELPAMSRAKADSSDSLTASGDESAEGPYQQLRANRKAEARAAQKPRVQPAPGLSLDQSSSRTPSLSATSTATTSRLEPPAVGSAKASSSRPQRGFSRALDKVFGRTKKSPSAEASNTSNVSPQPPAEE